MRSLIVVMQSAIAKGEGLLLYPDVAATADPLKTSVEKG